MIAGYKTINPITKEPTGFVEKIQNGTKIHTIRRGDRWSKAFAKAQAERRDLMIQHSTGVRTKHFKNFQTNKVKCVQKIIIQYQPHINNKAITITIDGISIFTYKAHIINLLIKNDGFEFFEDFRNWFIEDIKKNGPFIGEITHWTNLKY